MNIKKIIKTLFCLIWTIPTMVFIFQSCNNIDFSIPDKQIDANSLQKEDSNYIYNDTTIHNIYLNIFRSIKNNDIDRLANIYFRLGHYFLSKNKSDSAFFYFNHSKEAFLLEKRNSSVGKSLINMAIIQANEGDYFGSEETSVEALKYLKSPQDNSSLSAVYNCLAISKTEQKDYPQAIEYYDQSLKYPTSILFEISKKNNQAVVNIKAKNYFNAIKILTNLSYNPILESHPQTKATVLDNLAYAKWLYNPSFNAESELYKALHIREKTFDSIGQIANHSHLSEYFEKTNTQKAIFHANKMYEIAEKLGTPDDQLEALQKLISLDTYSSNKRNYFKTYLKLSDSIQTVRSQSKNQFALIRYEVEKNKEENAQLKAENAQKNYQILKQKVIVFSIAGITILTLVLLIFWYRRRKAKFRQERIDEVHRTELKYSKKIHDEVANGIYFLMVQLENNSDAKPTKMINELEELYHKSRDISHDAEFKLDLEKDFSVILRTMIHPYGAKDTKIILIGNEPHIWENISVDKKEEIYFILKELMTNMKKHSEANIVTLKFKKDLSYITAEYSDNGIGLINSGWNPEKSFKNIKTRLDSVRGNFYIDHKKLKGLYIKIIIPV